ncbi:MAG TPA: hypothetical protein VJ654_14595 [Noviherbaspirillum sp.]|nr:hypothetical protein [Noviherbaspirillum sp.]
MNDNGCFEVPVPIAFALTVIMLTFVAGIIFMAGMTAGIKYGADNCTATTQQKAQHE